MIVLFTSSCYFLKLVEAVLFFYKKIFHGSRVKFDTFMHKSVAWAVTSTNFSLGWQQKLVCYNFNIILHSMFFFRFAQSGFRGQLNGICCQIYFFHIVFCFVSCAECKWHVQDLAHPGCLSKTLKIMATAKLRPDLDFAGQIYPVSMCILNFKQMLDISRIIIHHCHTCSSRSFDIPEFSGLQYHKINGIFFSWKTGSWWFWTS